MPKKPAFGVHKNVTKYKKKNGKKKDIPYLRVSAGPLRGEYVHRLIAEALLRRPLKDNETVDHLDRNSLNCEPKNLQVLSWSDHGKATRSRHREKKGLEGIAYEVVLNGAEVFDVCEPIFEMAASADKQ